MKIVLLTILAIGLYSCDGGTKAPKAVPGAGGTAVYELMEEDSAEVKADTAQTQR